MYEGGLSKHHHQQQQQDGNRFNNNRFIPSPITPQPSLSSSERILACGALTAIMDGSREGQKRCLQSGLHQVCVSQLKDNDPLLRRWLCITLGKLWCGYEDARFVALRDKVIFKKNCLFLFFGTFWNFF